MSCYNRILCVLNGRSTCLPRPLARYTTRCTAMLPSLSCNSVSLSNNFVSFSLGFLTFCCLNSFCASFVSFSFGKPVPSALIGYLCGRLPLLPLEALLGNVFNARLIGCQSQFVLQSIAALAIDCQPQSIAPTAPIAPALSLSLSSFLSFSLPLSLSVHFTLHLRPKAPTATRLRRNSSASRLIMWAEDAAPAHTHTNT